MRSAGITLLGHGFSQALRMASNLILTRLLYPEAFGLMALIMVFIVGLTMLSDVGVGPSIQQSKRGDEQAFIDTAWTIQLLRGVLLTLACGILGMVAARIYGDARLETMLPVAGLSLLVSGFNPTRIETASRHLVVGRLTLLELIAQFATLVVIFIMAVTLRSVWALVLGNVVGAAIRLAIMHFFLPGPRNRWHWEATAARELIAFGKWIFLATMCAFLLTQGDKAILGKYLSLEMLGIYNIGYSLASFAQGLAGTIMGKTMIPMYRECPPGASLENFRKVRRARFALTGSVFLLQFALAFGGIWLVSIMYDARFAAAGSVVVAIACMNVPYLVGMTYDIAALTAGDSRGAFLLVLFKSITQTTMFIVGAELAGLPGALLGVWLAQILAHPFVALLARRHHAWDWLHDAFFATVGLVLTGLALWLHHDALTVLQTFSASL
jgi:O-antigen/teichoic acid export membrane protein